MAAPSFFELSQIEDFVQAEFNQRSKNIGFDYGTGNYAQYKGPRSAWVRVCSNRQDTERGLFGFIMYGVNGFDDTYGFQKNTPGTVLGYDVNGKEHRVNESSFKHRPTPGVTGLDVDLGGGAGKFRKVSIKWQCWSAEQLDYLESYFMLPTLSIFVEWGWNNYDPTSLLNLSKIDGIYSTWEKAKNNGDQKNTPGEPGLKSITSNEDFIKEKLKKSSGNYDFSLGRIVDYSYTLRSDGGYDVTTVIANPSQLYTAFSTKDSTIIQKNELRKNILDYFKSDFSRIVELVERGGSKKSGDKPIINVNEEYGPEDRAFYGPRNNTPKKPNSFELFSTDTSFWISFGLVIDIVNYFYSQYDVTNNIPHYTFVIKNSIICAHANLKSTDKNVLLIPNAHAPSGNPSEGKEESTTSLEKANKLLKEKISTSNRVDLTEIICEKRLEKSTASFPDYTLSENGNAGYLRNLYVNAEKVRKAFETHETIDSALMEILGDMSKAACGIWNFEIRQIGTSGLNGSYLTIVDTNYIGPKSIDELAMDNLLYEFDLIEANSIVKSATFTVKPASSITMQAMFSSSPENTTTVIPKQYISYQRQDRIFGDLVQAEQNIVKKETSKEEVHNRTLPVEVTYAIVKINGKGLIRLCEPDIDIQKSIMSDLDTHNNALHNGIMPNTSLELTVQGISGLRFLDCFSVKNGLPKIYKKDVLFQITNIKHVLQDGNWDTIITAGVRPKATFINKKS